MKKTTKHFNKIYYWLTLNKNKSVFSHFICSLVGEWYNKGTIITTTKTTANASPLSSKRYMSIKYEKK